MKILFWVVLVLWIGLIVSVYTLGATNSWIFHNESLITYTTSGMTNEQASSFYKYVTSFTDSQGNYKYYVPTFIPNLNNTALLNLDNGSNTYTEQFLIPNYQQYGLTIESRGQSEGMATLWGVIGGVLLVFGGLIGIQSLYWYAYDKKEFDRVWNNIPKETL